MHLLVTFLPVFVFTVVDGAAGRATVLNLRLCWRVVDKRTQSRPASLTSALSCFVHERRLARRTAFVGSWLLFRPIRRHVAIPNQGPWASLWAFGRGDSD